MPHYSEMVERVARALSAHAVRVARRFDTTPEEIEAKLPQAVEWDWPNRTDEAAIAIEAMREPTEAMTFIHGSANWSKMVQAALTDEPMQTEVMPELGLAPPREG